MNPAIIYQTVKFALLAKGVSDAEAETRSRAKFTEANAVARAAMEQAREAGESQNMHMYKLQQKALEALATWAQTNA